MEFVGGFELVGSAECSEVAVFEESVASVDFDCGESIESAESIEFAECLESVEFAEFVGCSGFVEDCACT